MLFLVLQVQPKRAQFCLLVGSDEISFNDVEDFPELCHDKWIILRVDRDVAYSCLQELLQLRHRDD
jgi:hypothetical protein